YNNRGIARVNLGDNQGAIDDYSQAIKLDPTNANAYNNRGFVYYDLNNKQNAIDDWQTSIRINNKSSDTLLGLAVALYNQGKQEEAYSFAQQALKLDKNFADVKFLKEKHFWSDQIINDARILLSSSRIKKFLSELP
ncbi:MAG: tetratricopeptide repeat protein, partial [Cylindrospermopsis raciborskii KL1]